MTKQIPGEDIPSAPTQTDWDQLRNLTMGDNQPEQATPTDAPEAPEASKTSYDLTDEEYNPDWEPAYDDSYDKLQNISHSAQDWYDHPPHRNTPAFHQLALESIDGPVFDVATPRVIKSVVANRVYDMRNEWTQDAADVYTDGYQLLCGEAAAQARETERNKWKDEPQEFLRNYNGLANDTKDFIGDTFGFAKEAIVCLGDEDWGATNQKLFILYRQYTDRVFQNISEGRYKQASGGTLKQHEHITREAIDEYNNTPNWQKLYPNKFENVQFNPEKQEAELKNQLFWEISQYGHPLNEDQQYQESLAQMNKGVPETLRVVLQRVRDLAPDAHETYQLIGAINAAIRKGEYGKVKLGHSYLGRPASSNLVYGG